MYTNKQYDASMETYRESAALQQLLEAIDSAAQADSNRSDEANEFICSQFTITVGGVQTAFWLGGPQIDALCDFVRHIAAENFYTVDLINNIVSE